VKISRHKNPVKSKAHDQKLTLFFLSIALVVVTLWNLNVWNYHRVVCGHASSSISRGAALFTTVVTQRWLLVNPNMLMNVMDISKLKTTKKELLWDKGLTKNIAPYYKEQAGKALSYIFYKFTCFFISLLFIFTQWAKSPKQQSVGVYFWKYGTVFWTPN